MRKLSLMAVLVLLMCLWGCGDEAAQKGIDGDSALVNVTTAGNDADSDTGADHSELLNPPTGEIHYTEAELQIVKTAIGDEEGAKEILKQLNGFGIYNIIKAEMSGDEELEVETSEEKIYVLYCNKKYHIYGMKENGEYIYTEVQ